MRAITRSDESAIVVIRESTRTRMAIRRNPKTHVKESHQPIHQPSDLHTEAVGTTTGKKTQSGAVTAPTDPTAIEAEMMTKIIEATENDQSPQRSPSTVLAGDPSPALTPMLTPTATPKSTKSHSNHRESGVRMTKSTKSITASGSALAATTKTCRKKKKTATAQPKPASAR